MKNENYWQQFLSSGNIQDYLNYRCNNQRNKESLEEKAVASYEDRGLGVNSNAGVCERNRNDFESGAYRGI